MSSMDRLTLPRLGIERDTPWGTALREGAVAGTVAGVLSSGALAAVGLMQNGRAAAPINAASHWLWGDESLREDDVTLRHTLTGFLTQHAASVFWATLYSRVYGHHDDAKLLKNALIGGAATSAVAALVDYTMVPKRLTPGYEHRLSLGAMVGVYAVLAAGFAAGAMAMRKRPEKTLYAPRPETSQDTTMHEPQFIQGRSREDTEASGAPIGTHSLTGGPVNVGIATSNKT